MNRIRWIFPLLAAAVGVALQAGMAQAQVAAPLLIPGSADVHVNGPAQGVDPTFVPLNAAVMNWNNNSVVGIGMAKTTAKPPSPSKEQDLTNTYAGFRGTGTTFAFAIDVLNTKLDNPQTNQDFTLTTNAVGLSAKPADWLALGIRANNIQTQSGTGSAAVKDTFSGWVFGASVQMASIFYVGAGIGKDKEDQKATVNTFSDDRSVMEYGLALYTGDKASGAGNVIFHVEYNVVDKDDFTDATGTKTGGFTRNTATAELDWKGVLVSYSGYGASAKTGKAVENGTAIEAGWAPKKGLYVTGRVQSSANKNGSTKVSDDNTTAINLGFAF